MFLNEISRVVCKISTGMKPKLCPAQFVLSEKTENIAEDEYHFLFSCKEYQSIREKCGVFRSPAAEKGQFNCFAIK